VQRAACRPVTPCGCDPGAMRLPIHEVRPSHMGAFHLMVADFAAVSDQGMQVGVFRSLAGDGLQAKKHCRTDHEAAANALDPDPCTALEPFDDPGRSEAIGRQENTIESFLCDFSFN